MWLWEGTKVQKETSNNISLKIVEQNNNISKISTAFEECVENISANNRVGVKMKHPNCNLKQ